MWNKNQKLILADFLLSFLCCWTFLPYYACDSHPVQPQSASSVSFNTHQWQSMVRDAIKYLQQHQQQNQRQDLVDHRSKIRFAVDPPFTETGNEPTGTSLVKLRNIRSGFGDVANVVRLVQLHELEKEWASKARPRFGKRAEVAQDNFLPPYISPYAGIGMISRDEDDYDQEAKVSMLSEEYVHNVGDRKGEGRFMRYPEDYLMPGA